eukprot:244132-Chlamydomonas_euryale.AAC.14
MFHLKHSRRRHDIQPIRVASSGYNLGMPCEVQHALAGQAAVHTAVGKQAPLHVVLVGGQPVRSRPARRECQQYIQLTCTKVESSRIQKFKDPDRAVQQAVKCCRDLRQKLNRLHNTRPDQESSTAPALIPSQATL